MYIYKTSVIRDDKGLEILTLFPGTPVIIDSEENDESVSIRLEGEYVDGVLYYSAKKQFAMGTTQYPKTVYTGIIKKEALAETLEIALQKEEELYFERCSTCHTAGNPERYTQSEWLGILDSMQVHAGLNNSDIDLIHRYLSAFSKDTPLPIVNHHDMEQPFSGDPAQ